MFYKKPTEEQALHMAHKVVATATWVVSVTAALCTRVAPTAPVSTAATPTAPAVQSAHESEVSIGTAEGLLLEASQRLQWPAPSGAALKEDGCILYPRVIERSTAATLRAHCESQLVDALDAVGG